VHRNTLRQRLTKIESLTGISLAEAHDWLPLHFAVKLARMQEGNPRCAPTNWTGPSRA
jgi:DNA-binding PucR family transcriptional regulator